MRAGRFRGRHPPPAAAPRAGPWNVERRRSLSGPSSKSSGRNASPLGGDVAEGLGDDRGQERPSARSEGSSRPRNFDSPCRDRISLPAASRIATSPSRIAIKEISSDHQDAILEGEVAILDARGDEITCRHGESRGVGGGRDADRADGLFWPRSSPSPSATSPPTGMRCDRCSSTDGALSDLLFSTFDGPAREGWRVSASKWCRQHSSEATSCAWSTSHGQPPCFHVEPVCRARRGRAAGGSCSRATASRSRS